MTVEQGTCARCGAAVFWSRDRAAYLDMRTKSTTCTATPTPHVPEEDA